jgi:hypothetical protein
MCPKNIAKKGLSPVTTVKRREANQNTYKEKPR